MVVLNWNPTTYPIVLDAWANQTDLVNDVMASHPNSLASAVYAIEAKLGIDNDIVSNVGGLQFDTAGKAANPGGVGEPTVWSDNSGGPGFPLQYTDDLGNTYNISQGSFIGFNYAHGGLVVVGDLCSVTGADTLGLADTTGGVAGACRGLVINTTGAVATVLYGGEVQNGAWALTSGATYYLGLAGAFVTAAGLAGIGARNIVQEVGFARNATTLVFRPTIVSGL